MIYSLKVSLFMILFGGLFFSALSYYLPVISNPTWPFYIFSYLASLVIVFSKFKSRISIPDLMFIIFISYILLSFSFYGMSSSVTFFYYLVFFMVLPYIAGKAIGKDILIKDLNIVFFIAMLTMIPMIIEISSNPSLLFSDRLIIFNDDTSGGVGGSSISINMNLIFGSLALICFCNIFLISNNKYYLNIFFFILSLSLMLLFSSRSALISITATFFIAYALNTKISFISLLRLFLYSLIFITIFLFIFFNFLSEERASFIYEIPLALESVSSVFGCNLMVDGSIISRIILWTEGLRLFLDNIFFGAGASNYGHMYCGQIEDLASPHMYILHITSELGLIGLLIYILFIYFIFKKVTKNNLHHHSKSLFVMLIIWIFFTLISQLNGNYFYDMHLFIISGLLISKSTDELMKQNNLQAD